MDALCSVVHRSVVEKEGRDWARRLKEVVPRQQYEVSFTLLTFVLVVEADRVIYVFRSSFKLRSEPILLREKGSLISVIVLANKNAKLIPTYQNRIAAVRKDVVAGLTGGGDYSRIQKHLAKQRAGKQRLKERSVGRISIPTEAFFSVLGGREGKKKDSKKKGSTG